MKMRKEVALFGFVLLCVCGFAADSKASEYSKYKIVSEDLVMKDQDDSGNKNQVSFDFRPSHALFDLNKRAEYLNRNDYLKILNLKNKAKASQNCLVLVLAKPTYEGAEHSQIDWSKLSLCQN